MGLNETVACAVNGLTAGVFSKEEVRESITEFVNKNYFKISMELPISVFQALYETFGMTFEIQDGMFMGVKFEEV